MSKFRVTENTKVVTLQPRYPQIPSVSGKETKIIPFSKGEKLEVLINGENVTITQKVSISMTSKEYKELEKNLVSV